ncbi:hypothetical protein GGR26_000490 [Lewinella marina]|uniref:Uncharacterized protein n=1 Tax=Neolewinella marina TaxID=438751 RepID=A0A2G0CJE4_9BACT|nr:hypothetical protein [Neolewinella marina]NJB84745.1 hypothetical protein [Neolewinella marina]PHL00096.1 hypothetical protein CGL56_03380 [Neolewinella marina]
MSSIQDTSSDFQHNTLAYINRLDQQSAQVVALAEELPMPLSLRLELQQSWRITRQKLAYFRRELERADDGFKRELEQLHNALLPEVISYQVRVGAMMISDTCTDHRYLHRWKAIWTNFKL